MNILKPPFIKCLLHEISCFVAEKTENSLLQQKFSMTMALTRSVLQILLKHFLAAQKLNTCPSKMLPKNRLKTNSKTLIH